MRSREGTHPPRESSWEGRVLRGQTPGPGHLAHPLSVVLPQVQLPEALHQLSHSLKELLLLFHHSVLLPMWHLLLVALARAQEYCHEACR